MFGVDELWRNQPPEGRPEVGVSNNSNRKAVQKHKPLRQSGEFQLAHL